MSYPTCEMHIAETLAMERTFIFLSETYDTLSKVMGKRQDFSLPPYAPDDFIKLLEALKPKGDHVRAYFAVYRTLPEGTPVNNLNNELVTDGRDRENLLTIIYRSVIHTSGKDVDAFEYFFIHEKKGFMQLDPIIAENWITHWQDYVDDFAIQTGIDYQTKSTLFPMEKVNHPSPKMGLYNMLKDWAGHFKSLKIFFATYKDEFVGSDKVKGQLTFIIYCQNDYAKPFLLDKDFTEKIKEYYQHKILSGDNNDTGLPCPPAKNCP